MLTGRLQLILFCALLAAVGCAIKLPEEATNVDVAGQAKRYAVSALIVEPRCHATLPLTVANMRASLPGVPIQVFYGASNRHFVEELLPPLRGLGRGGIEAQSGPAAGEGAQPLILQPLPGKYYEHMNFTAYSLLLESPEFWDMVMGEKVLVFETDTWVCQDAESKLQHWLQYDYVGAPWNHNVVGCAGGVGNGGFSLRSRQAMHDAATSAKARLVAIGDPRPPGVAATNRGKFAVLSEDIFFCEELERAQSEAARKKSSGQAPDSLSPVLPSLLEADKFAEEERVDLKHGDPLGVHRPWVYEAAWWELKRSCPGLHLLYQAFNKPTGARSACGARVMTEAEELLETYLRFLEERRIDADLRRKSWSSALQVWSSAVHRRLAVAVLALSLAALH